MSYNVFISYRDEYSGEIAGRLYLQLLIDGYSPFYDHSTFHNRENSGIDFRELLANKIAECTDVVLVLADKSLDRCINENDVVRFEIETALRLGKHIVPYVIPGYTEPTGDIPESIRTAAQKNGTKHEPTAFESGVAKLEGMLVSRSSPFLNPILRSRTEAQLNTKCYFDDQLKIPTKILSVDMAFHSGFELIGGENAMILKTLLESGVNIRVMINTTRALHSIAKHMTMPERDYPPQSKIIKKWKDWEMQSQKYAGKLEFRLSDIPFLRRVYIVHTENPDHDTINIKHYTYDNPIVSENLQNILPRESAYFELFESEFKYLWDRATPPSGPARKEKAPR